MTTYSGTGTRATTPTVTTAADLVAVIREALGDTTADVWPDAELLGYLNEGVREYSQHLRRIDTVTIAAVDGERRYALPADLVHMISVEYPSGGTPPAYIHRLGRTNRRFSQGRLYDVLPSFGTLTPPALVLSFDPDPATALTVTYSHPHATAATLSSAVTVPYDHQHVLLHYALYAAARRLGQKEQADPTSSSSLLMSQLAANTRRLELTYLNALNRILTQQRGDGTMVAWNGRP